MTFVDTNVLPRYLPDNHAVHGPQARVRLGRAENLTIIPHILVAVAVVLEKVYAVDQVPFDSALQAFSARDNIQVQGLGKARVTAALQHCRPSKRVGFAGAVLWALAGQDPRRRSSRLRTVSIRASGLTLCAL